MRLKPRGTAYPPGLSVNDCPPGRIEDRLAWMRARQEWKQSLERQAWKQRELDFRGKGADHA
jgi:hypothetical protein